MHSGILYYPLKKKTHRPIKYGNILKVDVLCLGLSCKWASEFQMSQEVK